MMQILLKNKRSNTRVKSLESEMDYATLSDFLMKRLLGFEEQNIMLISVWFGMPISVKVYLITRKKHNRWDNVSCFRAGRRKTPHVHSICM